MYIKKPHLFVYLDNIFKKDDYLISIAIIAMLILAAALEVLGIGLVLPLISILGDSQYVNNDYYMFFSSYFPVKDYKLVVIYMAVFLLAVFVIKNTYLAFVVYIQNKFVFERQVVLSNYLLNHYLNSSYDEYLQRSSSTVLRNFATEITSFYTGVVSQAFVLFAEIVVVVFVATLIFLINPYVMVVVSAFMIFTSVLYLMLIKKTLKYNSDLRADNSGLRLKLASEALSCFKEIRMLGKEKYFLELFDKSNSLYAKGSRIYATINQTPRLFIETMGVLSILIVVVVLSYQNYDLYDAVPLLAVFAAALLRIMPSITRIVNAINSIKFFLPTIKNISTEITLVADGEIEKKNNENVEKLHFNHEVSFAQVSFSYPAKKQPAVDNLSFELKKGEAVAFIGYSGSGKTTIINLLLGLHEPNKGMISIDGVTINDIKRSWQRNIGYVPQSVNMIDLPIKNNIALGERDEDIDVDRLWNAIRSAHLDEFVSRLPDGLDTAVGESGLRISGGEKQRIGIARALYFSPEVLVFDEATSSLDSKTESEIIKVIDELKEDKTIVIVAHRMTTIKSCDRVFLMKEGKLVDSGAYDELKKKQEFANLSNF